MMNLLESILGIETVKSLGVVDTVHVGKIRYTTELGICRANGHFALKVCVATRGWISRNRVTLLWSLESEGFSRIQADLQRILSELNDPHISEVTVNPIMRSTQRLFGFRYLSELGEINLNTENSTSYGFIGEISGVRILAVKLVAPSATSLVWFPQSTVQAIATRLETIGEEAANKHLEHISDSANAV